MRSAPARTVRKVEEFLLDEREWPATLADAPRSLLRQIVAGTRQNPALIGLAAGGSFRSGRMDEFSDLDLVVVVEPAASEDVRDRRGALAAALGPLLACFTGEHVGEPRLLVCLYGPPPVHVDLKFVAPDDLAVRIETPIVLWDRDGRVRIAFAAGIAVYPAPVPQWIEDRFWIWVHYAASKIGRGELFEALDFMSFLRTQVLGPLALKEASAQPSGVRHVERLAPARARQLQETVARYDARDLVSALRAAVALYRELRNRAGVETLKRRNEAEAAALDYLDAVERRLGNSDASPTID
jgi:nucleotidyltransferase-like protein